MYLLIKIDISFYCTSLLYVRQSRARSDRYDTGTVLSMNSYELMNCSELLLKNANSK